MNSELTNEQALWKLLKHHSKLVKLASEDVDIDPFEVSLLSGSAGGVAWAVERLAELIPKLPQEDHSTAYEAACQAIRGSEMIGAIAVKSEYLSRQIERHLTSHQQARATKANASLKDERQEVASRYAALPVSEAIPKINAVLKSKRLKTISKQTLYRYRSLNPQK